MTEKRNNKVIKFTVRPNIDKALREYCKENNVLLSDVLKIILIDFLYNAQTSSRLVKSYIEESYMGDMMPSPQSPKKSDLIYNYDLMKILINLVNNPEFSLILDPIVEEKYGNSLPPIAYHPMFNKNLREIMREKIDNS